MTAIRPIIAVGTALLLLWGCSGPDLTGTWVGQKTVDTRPDADPLLVKQLSTVKLVIKPNGVAFLSDGGMPLEGTVYGSNKGGVFRAESVASVRMERQSDEVKSQYPDMNLTAAGSSELILENPGLKTRVVLHRQSQPDSP